MIQPPKIADWFLKLYCRKDKLEDLQGDLYEYYDRNREKKGARMANLIYFIDVLKFFRLYTLKKLKIKGLMNFMYLFNSYLKTSTRNIARNRLFSGINFFSLAVSMSVGVLMIVFFTEAVSFDDFHERKADIYRINNNLTDEKGEQNLFASTSPRAGMLMDDAHSAIEDVVIIKRNYSMDLTEGNNTVSIEGFLASKNFLKLFTFPMISGDPNSALSEPNSIVITEKTTKKLFKDENPVGRQIKVGSRDMDMATITGVVSNPPKNSHLQFDALASFITHVNASREKDEKASIDEWNNMWMYHVYFAVPDKSRLPEIDSFLSEISEQENKTLDHGAIDLHYQTLSSIAPSEKDMSNKVESVMDWTQLYILFGLTMIIILSAAFNYTNLSIARALRRSKEIGIRKVVGATRLQVFGQFQFEAVFIAIISVLISVGLFALIQPQFMELSAVQYLSLDMQLKLVHVLPILLFAITVGMISGLLPSIILSKTKAIHAIKDVSKLKLFRGMNLRMVLVVFQFTLSIAFIIIAFISYKQYVYSVNFDLGYNTENVLNIKLKDNDADILEEAFRSVSGVADISKSCMIPSTGSIWGDHMKYEDPLDSLMVHLNYVDENYISLHDFEMIAGNDFERTAIQDERRSIIVNEQLLKRFNIGEPHEAIGKTVYMSDEKFDPVIVGVVKDFQHTTLGGQKHPFVFVNRPQFYYLNLKINSGNILELMDRLEASWSSVDPVHTFEARFFSEDLERTYAQYKMIFKIVGFLAFLAISIATLGFLGIAVYTIETRIKEISIRKVLGATEQNLIMILSKSFLIMLIVASVIAVTGTFLLFQKVIFAEMENVAPVGVLEFGSGVVIVSLIASITVGWLLIKAVRANPALNLRNE